MRRRLATAVQALLSDAAICDLTDAARLAAVVLFAKSNAVSGRTRIWAAELGRWLGVSESWVGHTVLPALRSSHAVKSKVVTDASGQVIGLECVVMPTWKARQKAEHDTVARPLALSRRELATLLRLCEALFGPGWAPADRAPTPPGMLAARRGRGAATDRLGLLLMVLQTRADGWLRLCGGTVDTRRGRPAVTVARALGCSASTGAKVLERLRSQGVVQVVRRDTASGLHGSSRVRISAVAAAHGHPRTESAGRPPRTSQQSGPPSQPSERRHGRAAARPKPESPNLPARVEGHEQPAALRISDRPATTPGDLATAPEGRGTQIPNQCTEARACQAEGSDLPTTAPLHAHHPSLPDVSGESSGNSAHSGEAVEVAEENGRHARANTTVLSPRKPVRLEGSAGNDALRAEKAKPALHRNRTSQPAVRDDCRRVLSAITPIRDRLKPEQRCVAQAAIGAVLRAMPVDRLIEHLESRLAPISFEAISAQPPELRSPLGWLLSQLPKVTLCPSCDRTYNGPVAGLKRCGPCSVPGSRAAIGRCDDCGQQRTLDSNRLCQRCHNDRVNLSTCGACGTRAHVDATTGFCPGCENWLRDFCAPELSGLDAAGQKVALRLMRGSEPEVPKPRPSVQVTRPKPTPRWQQHWRRWAERPLPEDHSDLAPRPIG